MADYISSHSGSQIDGAVNIIEDATFSEVMYGVTPEEPASDTALATTKYVKDTIYTQTQLPVGYIFEWSNSGIAVAPNLTTPEAVAQYFGYGTWELFGVGRMTVCIDSNDDIFGADSVGGSKDAVVVAHDHTLKTLIQGNIMRTGGSGYKTGSASTKFSATQIPLGVNSTGVSGVNKNLPPYITVYRYRRIA